MVDYMSLGEQVDADFVRARRKAVLRRLLGRLPGVSAPGRLLCFEEVRKKLGAAGGVRLGRRAVRAADVVGSTGRCADTPAGRPGAGTGGGAEGERARPSRRPGLSHGHTG